MDYGRIQQNLITGDILTTTPVMEMAATNLCLQSAAFLTAPWVTGGGIFITYLPTSTSPNGLNQVFQYIGNSFTEGTLTQDIAVAATADWYIASIYYRPAIQSAGGSLDWRFKVTLITTGDVFYCDASETGGVTDQSAIFKANPLNLSIQAIPNIPQTALPGLFTWYRVQMRFQNKVTNAAGIRVEVVTVISPGVLKNSFGVVWGAQLELIEPLNIPTAKATSQIPTTTAAVTRPPGVIPFWQTDTTTVPQFIGEPTMFTGSVPNVLGLSTNSTGGASLVVRKNATAANSCNINVLKGRGTNLVPLVVVNGDLICQFNMLSYDGTNYVAGSAIWAGCDAVPIAGFIPSNLQFRVTTAAGANIEGARISNAGVLVANFGLTIGTAQMLASNINFTNNAGVAAGTLLNAPAAGNPTKWIPINDNGTVRNIPAW